MNIVKTLLFASIVIASCINVQAQNTQKKRVILWLKGFATEEAGYPGWLQYDDMFTSQRYARGIRPSYFTDRAIDSIAAITRFRIDSLLLLARIDTNVSFEPPIIIGHSMGGLVARSMERLNRIQNMPQQFGGLITVATPNQGSELNRSLSNGAGVEWLQKTIETLTTVFDNGQGSSIRMFPLPLTVVDQNSSMSSIYRQLLHNRLDSFFVQAGANARPDGKSAPAFFDMVPGSNFLGRINAPSQPNDTMPMITIQCTAYFPTLYRMVHSFGMSRPHTSPIDGHDDGGLTKEIYKFATFVLAVSSVGTLLPIETMFSSSKMIQDPTAVLVAAGENNYFAEAFLRPWRTIKYDLPAGFCTLMGSANYQYRTISAWNTRLPDGPDGKPVFVIEQRGEVVPIITDEDDGTLSRIDQIHPNRSSSDYIRALGANHVSAQNHRAVREALDNIFDQNPRFIVQSKGQ
jgi:pimeloyl-ACP methyl ester carboxylesterase